MAKTSPPAERLPVARTIRARMVQGHVGRLASLLFSARMLALADQGFQGVASILATALLGRALPRADFGAVGLMIGLYYFVHGFHRSAIVLPYITEHRHFSDLTAERRYHSDWWWLSVVGSIVLAIALVGAALVAPLLFPISVQWLAGPLLLGATITPPLLALEFLRRWLFKCEKAGLAAFASGLFFVTLIGSTWVVSHHMPNALGGAIAWAFSALTASMVTLAVLRPKLPHWRASVDCFDRHRKFAVWLMFTHLPYVVYSNATVAVVIGALNGASAVAVFTACRTLTNPAISLVSAIDSLDKPRAARAFSERGIAGLRASIGKTRRVLIVVTGGYLGLVALFAAPLLALAFHGRYPDVHGEVAMLTLAFFLICLNQPSETLLIVLKASRIMFVTRAVTAVVTLASLLIARQHGIWGMAVAITISQATNLLLLILVERWLARARHGDDSCIRQGPAGASPS